MNVSVAFHTLGCKLNFSETSTLSRMLVADGFVQKDFADDADIYVINTCSVTENADKECRYLVRRIMRRAPDAKVVITGCYAQLKPAEIAGIEGVSLVLGAAEKFNLVHHLKEIAAAQNNTAKICSCDIEEIPGFHSSFSMNDRTRAFLKVQDGCDYTCTFCTIPMARGRSRSDSIDGALHNIADLAAGGVREIVLTGINLGDFGKGSDGGKAREETFLGLLEAIDRQSAVPRVRISSVEPNLLSNEMIDIVAASAVFMPHFHIPLQSGSNAVLAAMRRRYRRELYAEKVAFIKERMPHCCIGVDVIVGFPGETDAAFRETYDFLHSLDVSYFHVFTYSERANTPAADMSAVVPHHVRYERNQALRNLSLKKMHYFEAQHHGQVRKVLFERAEKDGMLEGYTDNYIKVTTPYDEVLMNRIVDWEI